MPKAESLARALEELAGGPGAITTEPLCVRVERDNVRAIVSGSGSGSGYVPTVVLDGSDNFATRFLVNDACVVEGVPLVHAAAIRWQGQILSVAPGAGGPCYRCLFEAPPRLADGVSCAEAGVAGPVVGVVGALAAEATLALLDGESPCEEGTVGRLLTYDGLRGATRVVRFRKNPGCLACGTATLGQLLPPSAYEVPAC